MQRSFESTTTSTFSFEADCEVPHDHCNLEENTYSEIYLALCFLPPFKSYHSISFVSSILAVRRSAYVFDLFVLLFPGRLRTQIHYREAKQGVAMDVFHLPFKSCLV